MHVRHEKQSSKLKCVEPQGGRVVMLRHFGSGSVIVILNPVNLNVLVNK